MANASFFCVVGFLHSNPVFFFQGVMVRLMLVLAPVMCVLGGIAVSASLSSYMKYLDGGMGVTSGGGGAANSAGGGHKGHKGGHAGGGGGGRGFKGKESAEDEEQRRNVAFFFVGIVTMMLGSYAVHCVWATSEAYSSPSIVLSARSHDGTFRFYEFTSFIMKRAKFVGSDNLRYVDG